MCSYDVFLSHAWSTDEQGRCVHARAIALGEALRRRGVRVWLDEDCMGADVDASMAAGIESSRAVVVLITRAYCEKVNRAAQHGVVDNCHKEFIYAHACERVCIPVVFEPSLRSIASWPPGVVKLHFASKLYVDGSDNIDAAAAELVRRLCPAPLPPRDVPIPGPKRGRTRLHL